MEIRILAAPASKPVAKALQVEPGTALLTTSRTTGLDGVPLTHVRLTFHEGHELVTRY